MHENVHYISRVTEHFENRKNMNKEKGICFDSFFFNHIELCLIIYLTKIKGGDSLMVKY